MLLSEWKRNAHAKKENFIACLVLSFPYLLSPLHLAPSQDEVVEEKCGVCAFSTHINQYSSKPRTALRQAEEESISIPSWHWGIESASRKSNFWEILHLARWILVWNKPLWASRGKKYFEKFYEEQRILYKRISISLWNVTQETCT